MADLVLDYCPRPLKLQFHQRRTRFSVAVCHRRFGKTKMAVSELQKAALLCPLDNPQFAYIGPTLKQAKRTAWRYLLDLCSKLPGYDKNESELWVTFSASNGTAARIYLLGYENAESIHGMYLDGAWLNEQPCCAAADHDKRRSRIRQWMTLPPASKIAAVPLRSG